VQCTPATGLASDHQSPGNGVAAEDGTFFPNGYSAFLADVVWESSITLNPVYIVLTRTGPPAPGMINMILAPTGEG